MSARCLLCLAALLPLGATAQVTNATLGRLFTSPNERLQLDRQRYSAPPPGAVVAAPPGPAREITPLPPPPAPRPVEVTGFVRRGDGSATVWVGNEPRETVLERVAPGAPIPVDVGGRKVRIKPGQSVDPADGTVQNVR